MAIDGLNEGKAAGPNGICAEFLKLFDTDRVKWLTSMFNNIYRNSFTSMRTYRGGDFRVTLKEIMKKQCLKSLQERCSEVEDLQRKHDNFDLYNKLKEFTKKTRTYKTEYLLDCEGTVTYKIEDLKGVWIKKYRSAVR